MNAAVEKFKAQISKKLGKRAIKKQKPLNAMQRALQQRYGTK